MKPALVLIEVALNSYTSFVNRDAIRAVWRRVALIVVGLLPGVVAGTLIVSKVSPSWLKLSTYIILLPVILFRLAESTFTAIAYLTAGLIGTASLRLIPQILPSVLIGVPVGAFVIQHMRAETFRRICMSFDAWIVAFGVSSVMRDVKVVEGPRAFLFLAAVVVIDAWLLWRFFMRSRSAEGLATPVASTTFAEP